ncbi:MAG TPA: Hsp20/alpha crystallin family protein [Methanocorpusculum sp.]|nr:Hsp20/alpha crystallin family protein [Methanocorpusculum sp.]
MDEPGKDTIIEFIKNMIMSGLAGSNDEKKQGMPSVVGVKFIVAGGDGTPTISDVSDIISKQQKRSLPLELFESDTVYTLQTQLPGSCSDFSVTYTDGKLKLVTGKNGMYSAEIPLQSEIDPAKIESHARNGVLEIVCVKRG